MFAQIRPAIVMFALLAVLTGLVYPFAITGLAQVLFPWEANGSLLYRDGQPIGSALIGQPFDDPKYFWGRLSATSPYPYNAGSSSGSNYGPLSPALIAEATARIAALKAADPGNTQPIPVDLVTSSGSGLDPGISPAAALYQVPRVARVRGLTEAQVVGLVQQCRQGPALEALGEPTVNVLRLNLALDALK